MEKSTEIGKLTEALAKAQAVFLPVKKSIKVDFTAKSGQRVKYNYAPLDDVFGSCRKALSDNGLAIMQPTKIVEGKLIVETLLSHSSGEWIRSEIIIESETNSPQSKGSALSYARRYALSSLLGISSEEDDDAESAMGREPTPKAVITKPSEVPTREIKEALAKLDSGLIEKEVKVTEPPTELPDFKDGPDLATYAVKHGWTLTKMRTALGINNVVEIKDVKAATAVLFPNAKPKVGTLVEEAVRLGAVVE